MDLQEFKLKYLNIEKEKLGKIYSFVDFGNVNKWYEQDRRDGDDNKLEKDKKLAVEIQKLADFINLFSGHSRFYYGFDQDKNKSIHIIVKARKYFNRVITKPIQKIKHYLNDEEIKLNTRIVKEDEKGNYIIIPKCNFDVEICIDAIRLLDRFDTFCLFSSDADFAYLLDFLKRKRKKIILVKGGYAQYALVKYADLVVNAQKIKKYIIFIKPRDKSRGKQKSRQ